MAGPAGFEPANAGIKTRCLTAWRRPNRWCPWRDSNSQPWTYKIPALPVRATRAVNQCVVGVEGFEPPTSCSQSRRATRLRYTPCVVAQAGFEPATPPLSGVCSDQLSYRALNWCSCGGLNPGVRLERAASWTARRQERFRDPDQQIACRSGALLYGCGASRNGRCPVRDG